MECSVAVGVIASITSHISQLDIISQRLVHLLTIGTCTIAAVVIFETTGDGESTTAEEDVFNVRVDKSGLGNSRWNETDISAGTTARARRVPQSCFDYSAMFAIRAAVSWGKEVSKKRSIRPTRME